MTAIDDTPINRNFLSPLNYKFGIKRAPNINFFLQKISIPGVTTEIIDSPNMFNPIHFSASTVQYEELRIEFKVDENLNNYLEIHNWIRARSFPEKFDEYAAISSIAEYTGEGLTAELYCTILDSAKNPNYEFFFRDCFPTNLSSLEFSSVDNNVNFITATASFKFLLFDINKVI